MDVVLAAIFIVMQHHRKRKIVCLCAFKCMKFVMSYEKKPERKQFPTEENLQERKMDLVCKCIEDLGDKGRQRPLWPYDCWRVSVKM